MESTNRVWQKHLRAKGIVPFFLDRLQQHALSSRWQHAHGPFHFPINEPEIEDELSRAYFEYVEYFPYEFYLELTNHCNLDCVMCARPKMVRPLGVMTMPLFKKIIDEIADKQPYAYIHYYGIGESMVDVTLFDKLEYSKKKGLRNSVLFTNGQLLLVKDNYKRLAESGLTSIGVDLDGFCQDTYGKVRVGGDFEIAKSGIEKLYAFIRERGLTVRVELAYQVVSGINEHDLEPFVDWCNANEYEYKIVTMHDWAGLRDDVRVSDLPGMAAMHHTDRRNPCSFLWNGFTVNWDGRVPLCFHDVNLQECMGDVSKQSIEDVWTGAHRGKRRAHVCGRVEGLCAGCATGTAIDMPEFGSSLYAEPLRTPAPE